MEGVLISVILPVYNEEKYISTAIHSILAQTEADFELIVIDDASTDQTVHEIEKIKDERIRLYRNGVNRGIVHNLNFGLEKAKGKYIARMDGDDYSLPKRFAHQAEYMDRHPDVGLIGCYSKCFGESRRMFAVPDDGLLLSKLCFGSVFAHPSFFMRREWIQRHHIRYRESYLYAEDYDFLVQCAQKFRIGNVEKVLLFYRVHKSQISRQYKAKQRENADRVKRELLQYDAVDFSGFTEAFFSYEKIRSLEYAGEIESMLKALEKERGKAEDDLVKGLWEIYIWQFLKSFPLNEAFHEMKKRGKAGMASYIVCKHMKDRIKAEWKGQLAEIWRQGRNYFVKSGK